MPGDSIPPDTVEHPHGPQWWPGALNGGNWWLLESDQIIAADVCGQDGMVWGDGQSRGGEKQLAISRLQLAAAGVFLDWLRWLSGLQSPAAGRPAVFVKNHRWLRLATGQVGSNGFGTLGCPAAVSGRERSQR